MINDKIIKVCGMCNGDNIREIETLPVDMIGFIFYHKSPRFVFEMPDYLPGKAKRTGVFVNEKKETIEMYADRFGLDYIQLHGHESPEYCRTLSRAGYKIIKAFPIAKAKDLLEVKNYVDYCDYFVFDTKTEKYGGSGSQFDWNILNLYNCSTPFLLSGGINPYSPKALKAFHHPALIGYDLNSRFELSPGKKDVHLLKSFLDKLY